MTTLNQHDCTEYFLNQQRGQALPFYIGGNQRGRGFFGSLFRTVSPILKTAGKYFGKKLLNTGANVAADLASGENIKHSLKRRFGETGMNIKDDLIRRIQSGSGIKKRRRIKKRHLFRDIFQNGSS